MNRIIEQYPSAACKVGFFATASSAASTLVLSHWAQIVGMLFAVIAGCYTIRASKLAAKRAEMELAMREAELCAGCKSGNPPPACPLADSERPKNCPLNQKEN